MEVGEGKDEFVASAARHRLERIISLNKSLLSERVSKLPRHKLGLLFSGIDLVLGK